MTPTKDSGAIICLLKGWKELEEVAVVELLNTKKEIVGAVHLNLVDFETLAISETNNSETYYLVANGIGIYFSYFRKIIM